MATKNDFISGLKKHKIKKPVLDAFEAVNRAKFFDPFFKNKLYLPDEPIPIGYGEMSDPLLSLLQMLNHLAPKRSARVLEVGTGSGYSTALLAHLVDEVATVEHNEKLALGAKDTLAANKIDNVRIFVGDGTDPRSNLGIFDAIIIFGACKIRPLRLIQCLKKGGSMVFPMGPIIRQQIALVVNDLMVDDVQLYKTKFHEFCVFPPLRGMFGTDFEGFPNLSEEVLPGVEKPSGKEQP
ncbi:MAG TPA: protein-L-isoaspartate O-methyltransferase [Spirochaetota bacterium]|nr:protein-L-isoaspartate O-methyltransferase [Spirochaetota bacterium]HNT09570.1 protein-L-isoaspartate O-methyltransferase [Spirochaetota bacterium]HNV45614.1 protein-L-isoaspartate O-methyltransferase [Spirochaetota bacterium]HOS38953.1 protein-L-isoaspartate O-methyltransferase [Spirochaetota bacterium]HPI22909.1 protein-L-isoaspartate O-methyltransferase [Spirochaetota bacterium]